MSHETDEQRRPVDATASESSEPATLELHPLVPADSRLPVPRPAPKSVRPRRGLWIVLALLLLIGGALGGFYWWKSAHPLLPPGMVFGNGRIEADEIDIDTKYAGRIAQMFAEEGDMVKAGQVVARMDTRDLEASLKKAKAQVLQAHKAVDEAKANVSQQTSVLLLAKQEMERAVYLVQRGWQTKEVLDQRKQALDAAQAALNAAEARETLAEHALTAATHDVELYSV